MSRRFLPFLLIALSACHKQIANTTTTSNETEDGGCMQWVKCPFPGWLTPGGIDSADAYFAQAGRSAQDLQPLTFIVTDTTAQVMAVQYINGLPVLDDDVVFEFSGGALTSDSVVITTRPQSNDTTAHQTFDGLREAFLAHVSESLIEGGPLRAAPPTPPSPATYTNACLEVTQGYVDASSVPGAQVSYGKYLTRVWWVSPVNSIYPRVYVEDDNGKAWGVSLFFP